MEQRVSGAKLTPWQGIALVALAAVFLLAAQFVLSFLQYVLTYFHLLPSEAAYAGGLDRLLGDGWAGGAAVSAQLRA